jgi:hypothetical protein
MKTIARLFKSKSEVTSNEHNDKRHRKLAPSWINSRIRDNDEEIVIREKVLPQDEYQSIATSLCSMLEYTNAENLFENKMFLCNSSAYVLLLYYLIQSLTLYF